MTAINRDKFMIVIHYLITGKIHTLCVRTKYLTGSKATTPGWVGLLGNVCVDSNIIFNIDHLVNQHKPGIQELARSICRRIYMQSDCVNPLTDITISKLLTRGLSAWKLRHLQLTFLPQKIDQIWKVKSVRILQKIIHLASGFHIWGVFAQNRTLNPEVLK